MVADLWCIDDEKKYVYFMVDDGFADDVAGWWYRYFHAVDLLWLMVQVWGWWRSMWSAASMQTIKLSPAELSWSRRWSGNLW
jgi:hypothetical protein